MKMSQPVRAKENSPAIKNFMRDRYNPLREKELAVMVCLHFSKKGKTLPWITNSGTNCHTPCSMLQEVFPRIGVKHTTRTASCESISGRSYMIARLTGPPGRHRGRRRPDRSKFPINPPCPGGCDIPDTISFMNKLSRRLAGPAQETLIKYLDGKSLPIARHTQDKDATSGFGVGGMAKGYKLHAIWGSYAMPMAWSVHPLNVAEVAEAKSLIRQLRGEGYLLADCNFDRNFLYDLAAQFGHQLLAQRQLPGTRLGHRRQSSYRLRSIGLLEKASSPFGRQLYKLRGSIERQFGGMVNFGGGLQSLPAWVRTLPRVRLFVHAKLLINAARLRRLCA